MGTPAESMAAKSRVNTVKSFWPGGKSNEKVFTLRIWRIERGLMFRETSDSPAFAEVCAAISPRAGLPC
jgi:hypothetical protein